jgi:formate hydrogenlyase transcriptional activator
VVAKLAGWTKQAGDRTSPLYQLNIGPRLTLCFVFIILAMLLGNAVLLWQFHGVSDQAQRLSGVDQELIIVLQAHTNLMSFNERLDALALSEDTAELVTQAESLRSALLEESRRSRNALNRLPREVQLDPTLLPTLEAIQDALPAELAAITALAKSKDWQAVRLRLANQVRPLESRTSVLVENIDREVGEKRAQALLKIGQAQRRILFIVPITAALTLIFAAFLGLAITRSITRPLGRLMEGSKALAGGDFSHRVPAAGKDEIALLGNIFNDMIVRLQELYRELQRREAYLSGAQRLSRTGSFGVNTSSGEIFWSDETFRIFECDPVTKPTVDMIIERTHPEDRALVRQTIQSAAAEGRSFDFEHRLMMPDGSLKYVRVVSHPSTGDEPGGLLFVGAVTDITESKRAESLLRESEQRFRAIFNEAGAGITLVDLVSGGPVENNRALQKMLGRSREELSHLATYDELTCEEDREADAILFRELCNGTRETLREEKHLILRDGRSVWANVIFTLLRGPDGRPSRVIAIHEDITERKKAENDLQNAIDEIKKLRDQLYHENIALREEIDRSSMFEEIVGESPALQTVLARVAKVGPTDSTALVTGETGTGKELIARAIHKRSPRASRAFVSVNCAAVPTSLITSELFGHEKGAFTGATQRRLGRFELAEGGTIFIDEVGELPLETQIALLRVLQEREFERVGGTKTIRANVRVIAATNRDLQAAIEAGTFRSDLYYRLNVFPIEMPPLRERKEDIPVLVEYFIDRYASKAGKKFRGINRATLDRLMVYAWPGNIRELQNVIERSVIVCETENFTVDESWLSRKLDTPEPSIATLLKLPAPQEKKAIEAALADARGRVSGPAGAAARLGVPPSTLDSKIRAHKINKHRFKSA